VAHFPGFGEEAAAFLGEERDIHGIAMDTPSQEPGNSATFPVHYITPGAGKYGVENVRNRGSIKDRAAQVVVGVPRPGSAGKGPESDCLRPSLRSAPARGRARRSRLPGAGRGPVARKADFSPKTAQLLRTPGSTYAMLTR